MDNPVEQVGSDLADVGRKLGHAVATGASEVKDVLLGKPGPPVPQPPGFDWASTYGGLAKGDTDEYAKQYQAREAAQKTQSEFNQGALTQQGLETQLKQLNLDKLTRESEIVKELRGLDMSKPESAGRRKELFEEYALLNGKSLTGGGRPNFATGKTLEAANISGIDISRPMSEWTPEDFDLLREGYKTLETRQSSSTYVDPASGLTINRTASSGHNFPNAPKPVGAVPPAPAHLGGAPLGTGKSKPETGKPAAATGKSKYDTKPIRANYKRAMAGAKLTGPMAGYVEAYATDMGLPLPHQENKTIDAQIAAVQNAETRLNMMEADAASPNGPNDVDLLWNHLGMTAAGQKGVRVTKNIIEDAVKARPIGQQWGVEWHKLADGTFLSPQQRLQFVALARRRTEEEKRKLEEIRQEFGGGSEGATPAGGGSLLDQLAIPVPASTPR